MRVIKSGRVSIAASLLLGAVAHAADNSYASVRESEAVKAPSLPWNDLTVQRVSPASAYLGVEIIGMSDCRPPASLYRDRYGVIVCGSPCGPCHPTLPRSPPAG